ncbi:MAG: hypothetical protein J3Q66DRAFT_188444 [Benniella sp.]|nr:MAG: hypothetical protein J3Q66DRAFT_188444 [Benniella sp.]
MNLMSIVIKMGDSFLIFSRLLFLSLPSFLGSIRRLCPCILLSFLPSLTMPKRPAHVTSGVQRSFTQEDESGYVSDECPKAYSYGESEKDDTSDEQEIQPGQSIQLCFDELSDEDVVQCGLKDVRQKELGDDENSGKNVPSSEQEDHPVRHLFDDMLAKEKEPKEKLKEKSKRKSREVASGRARGMVSCIVLFLLCIYVMLEQWDLACSFLVHRSVLAGSW